MSVGDFVARGAGLNDLFPFLNIFVTVNKIPVKPSPMHWHSGRFHSREKPNESRMAVIHRKYRSNPVMGALEPQPLYFPCIRSPFVIFLAANRTEVAARELSRRGCGAGGGRIGSRVGVCRGRLGEDLISFVILLRKIRYAKRPSFRRPVSYRSLFISPSSRVSRTPNL